MTTTRRGFLRSAAGGTAAAAVASLVPAGCAPQYPARAADGGALQSLTPKEYGVARAAAEAILVGVPVTPDVVATRIDRELAVAGDPMRSDMKSVLGLMEHGTVLSFRRSRFTELSPEERRTVLGHWAGSRFNLRRAAFQAMRGFIVYFAYADDATRALTGFPGPWPERVQVPVVPVDFGGIA
ncbi:MAG: twin-arginine translocation signal domain-containing protein [Gemmatimonadota bacterium]